MLRQPDYLIMLLGRWRSDKCMDYIRHKILQSTEGVANKMARISDCSPLNLRPETDGGRQSGNGHLGSLAGANRTRALVAQGLTTMPALWTRRWCPCRTACGDGIERRRRQPIPIRSGQGSGEGINFKAPFFAPLSLPG